MSTVHMTDDHRFVYDLPSYDDPGTQHRLATLRALLGDEVVPPAHGETMARRVEVTPAVAEFLLETMIPNRKLIPGKVDAIARSILADEWTLNWDVIRIDPALRMMDGQHRSWAVIKAGRPITTMIAFNCPPEGFTDIDHTRSDRSLNHWLDWYFQPPNLSRVAATTRRAFSIDYYQAAAPERPDIWHVNPGGGKRFITVREFLHFYADHREQIHRAVQHTSGPMQHKVVHGPSIYSGLAYYLYPKAPEDVDQFFHELFHDTNPTTHPMVMRLQTKLRDWRAGREIPTKRTVMAYAVRAWNMFLEDENRTIRVRLINNAYPWPMTREELP